MPLTVTAGFYLDGGSMAARLVGCGNQMACEVYLMIAGSANLRVNSML